MLRHKTVLLSTALFEPQADSEGTGQAENRYYRTFLSTSVVFIKRN